MAEVNVPQSVALLVVFQAFLSSDHVTPATGKTIAITISKNGATTFANPAAGALNATEMASGWYKASLGSGDIDTLGPLVVRGASATVDDVGLKYQVTLAGPTATAVAAIQADTDDIQTRLPAALTTGGNIKADALLVGGATPETSAAIAAAVGAHPTETGMTLDHAIQAILTAVALKKSGMAGTTGLGRDFADTKTRATWTMDSSGNVSAVTFSFD